MDFSYFLKKITRSLNAKRTKRPVEADNPSSFPQPVPNRNLQEPYLFCPPPLTSTSMSCPPPTSRPTEPVYPKYYATKHTSHFRYTNPNYSQTAVELPSSPEQNADSESDSSISFIPPPFFSSYPQAILQL
ncbi:hypothetical protein DSO57_1030026 [Entomophthora muscae]|uniref:Uncharacterized protein n=1 Tax=Entomophthora muscae TaxID=34485 RepID=A0ACC2U0I2_9FUNG|nr:hypothetical protein DSO57_1030026 [Entomophthora muscae]